MIGFFRHLPAAVARALRVPAGLAVAAALLAAPAPAAAQGESEMRALTQKVDRLQRELTTLQRQVYRGESGGGDGASGGQGGRQGMSQAAAARLNSRLSGLEQTIRELTGRMEETQYQLRQLSQRLDKLSKDVDYRLSRLEQQAGLAQGQPDGEGDGQQQAGGPQQLAQGGGQSAGGDGARDRTGAQGGAADAGQAADEGQATGQGQTTGQGQATGQGQTTGEGQATDQGQAGATSGGGGQASAAGGEGQGGTRTLGQVSQQAVEEIRKNRADGGESGQSGQGSAPEAAGGGQSGADGQQSEQAGQTQTARAQPADYELPEGSPAEQYEHAFSLLRQADYAKAERALAAFLEAHPDHDLAGNAKYWLGETHYVRGNYSQAAVTFAEGFKTYADSSKAPDNLLKLGMSLAQIDRTEDACGIFAELLNRFPDAANNIRQRAKREQQRLGCDS